LFSGECFKTKQTIVDDKNIKTENQQGNISIKKNVKVDKKNLINPNQQHRYEEEKEEVGEGEVTEKINQMKKTEFSVNLSQTYLESEILDKRFKNEKSIHISSIFMIKEKKKQSKTKDSQKVSNEKEKRKEEEEIDHLRNSVSNITNTNNNNNNNDEDVDFLSKLKTKYNFSDNFTSIKEANHKTDQPQPTSQMMHSTRHFSETPTQIPLFPPQSLPYSPPPPPLPVPVPTKLTDSTQPPPPPLSPQEQFPVTTTYDTPPPSPLPTSNYSTPLAHDLLPYPPVSVGSFSDMMSSISSPSTPSPTTSTTHHSSAGKTRRFRPPKIPT